jgi:FAD/FMN-containing dehydrogenase
MHVPTARRLGLQVPELLELDRTEPMPAAMLVLMRELADADADVALAGEEEGSVAFWASRASNALLHGMDGPYLQVIKAIFPSRKVQGRLYLLGSMVMASYVSDLDADDVETIVELWNEAPTEQLAFAAELSMRLELSKAKREAQGSVAYCMERVRTHWS